MNKLRILGGITFVLLAALVGMVWFYAPQYRAVYAMLPDGIPFAAMLVFKSYKFWVGLPIITLAVLARTFTDDNPAKLSRLFSVLLICGMALLVLFYMAVVSPIEAQAVNGEIIIPLNQGKS
ncbi:MAG: hypothetical protein ACWA5R_09975 [bacterium]